jgi:uncharacterized protein YcbK (DUF882 family)
VTQVTEHFTAEEFACRDGSPYPASQPDDEADDRPWLETRLYPLCCTLEVIREHAGGTALHIDSGYRSLAYDDRIYQASAKDGTVAPASRSQHPKGRAADITHGQLTPKQMFSMVLELYAAGQLPYLGGVGLYPSFIHVDVRPQSPAGHLAIWGGSRPSNVA